MREAIPPLPQYAFMAWCLVKAQGQLYLCFTFILLYCACKRNWSSLLSTSRVPPNGYVATDAHQVQMLFRTEWDDELRIAILKDKV
jgi:hypothetical protein